MRYVSYLVIESYAKYRKELSNVDELRLARRRIMRAIKPFFPRGLGRWHFFGTPECPDGCRRRVPHGKAWRTIPARLDREDQAQEIWACPVCSGKWSADELRPQLAAHMNLLVDSAYIQNLVELKKAIAKADKRFYLPHTEFIDVLTPTEDVPDPIGKVRHWVWYINRATFLSAKWAPELADDMTEKRFHTTWTWGGADRWQDQPLWGTESPAAGGCPVCEGHITWERIERKADMERRGMVHVADGLWIIPPADGPPEGG